MFCNVGVDFRFYQFDPVSLKKKKKSNVFGFFL